MANPLIFADLPCTDLARSTEFYEELFGWEINRRVPGQFHQIVTGDEGKPNLGLFQADAPVQGSAPRLYLGVDDPTAMLERALQLGASKVTDERPCPEFNGSYAAFADPSGVEIVIWRYTEAH